MIVEQDENMQMELLTPLTANFMPETSYWNELDEDDEAWDYEYDGLPLDGTDLVQYKDAIQEMVDKENSFGSEDGKPCNLMQYFDGSPAIKEKVESAVVSVKEVNDVLYGCVTLQLKDHLQSDEMPELCDYITGIVFRPVLHLWSSACSSLGHCSCSLLVSLENMCSVSTAGFLTVLL